MPLSPSAQKVQDKLIEYGYHFTVIESETHTRTAQQAADLVHCSLGQIVKSLIFRGRNSGKPILVLTSGSNQVDEKRIGNITGEKIERATPDFVREMTGFAIGGVPPIGHIFPMDTYLDQDLMQYPTIWAAAGTPNSLFELTPEALLKMTRGTVIQV